MYNTYAMEATLKDSPVLSKPAPAGIPSSAVQATASSGAKEDSSNNSSLPVLNSTVPGKDTSGALAVINSFAGTDIPKDAARPDTISVKRGMDSSKLSSGQNRDSVGQVSAVGRTDSPKTGDSSIIIDSSVRKADSSVQPGSALSGSTAVMPGSTAGAVIPGSSPDSAASISGTASVPSVASSSVPLSLPKAGSVVKLSERKTTKGLRLVYADHIKGRKADTIVVIIPVDTGARLAQRPGGNNALVSSPAQSDTPALVSARPDHPAAPSNGTGASGQKTAASTPLFRPSDTSQKKTPAKSLFINSDCRNFATDYDVDKLRVKMLETSKDEDRITVAHKVFKTKCFATKQIRALSEVFTSDAQKFRFFETAYPFVSDDHFKELTDLLADPVYNSKFRSMTGQQ
jgi:hypothetical protein